jgi:hypothetical protein
MSRETGDGKWTEDRDGSGSLMGESQGKPRTGEGRRKQGEASCKSELDGLKPWNAVADECL